MVTAQPICFFVIPAQLISALVFAYAKSRVFSWQSSSIASSSSVIHHFQTSSLLKPTWSTKPNFMRSLLEKREPKLIDMAQVTSKMAAEPINEVNRLKKNFKTRFLLILIFGMDHQELKVYIFYIYDDHGLPWPWHILRQGQMWAMPLYGENCGKGIK